jgi:hypothetical protein
MAKTRKNNLRYLIKQIHRVHPEYTQHLVVSVNYAVEHQKFTQAIQRLQKHLGNPIYAYHFPASHTVLLSFHKNADLMIAKLSWTTVNV